MEIKKIYINCNWNFVKQLALSTIGKNIKNEPTSQWKKQILLCEHSPIRNITLSWCWENLKSWVSVHLVRHKIGIEHYVKTQRTDRTGIDRDNLPQGNLVSHTCVANAQAIITISRKRLCTCASVETREAWQEFIFSFKDNENELYSVCVPECIYRGFCPEFSCCGFVNTQKYQDDLIKYRNVKEFEIEV